MEKEKLLFNNEYEAFYEMAENSIAFQNFCYDSFGQDFSQDGFSDIEQICNSENFIGDLIFWKTAKLLLDNTKTGAIQFANGPRGICYQNLAEGRRMPILRLPVFDTTPPGVGDRLKPRFVRHGNFTPPRISPSCPQMKWLDRSIIIT